MVDNRHGEFGLGDVMPVSKTAMLVTTIAAIAIITIGQFIFMFLYSGY
jgi:hypothetical protein